MINEQRMAAAENRWQAEDHNYFEQATDIATMDDRAEFGRLFGECMGYSLEFCQLVEEITWQAFKHITDEGDQVLMHLAARLKKEADKASTNTTMGE